MVCLKAKVVKGEEGGPAGTASPAVPASEIKLLEIISNCQWEGARTLMLSRISQAISKDPSLGVTKSDSFDWVGFRLTFLLKSTAPAIIPPELKSKLPSEIYSIRIKVTKTKEIDLTTDTIEILDDEEEKRKFNIRLQKKLIDKIKFAERLRNLIIAEEQKGVKSSKFSVSREGIEKALKKYKTQLWKAYTGSNNLSLQQLKQALQAAKAGSNPDKPGLHSLASPSQSSEHLNMDIKTMNRIVQNQGLNVKYPTNVATPTTQISVVISSGQRLNTRVQPGQKPTIVYNVSTQPPNVSTTQSASTSSLKGVPASGYTLDLTPNSKAMLNALTPKATPAKPACGAQSVPTAATRTSAPVPVAGTPVSGMRLVNGVPGSVPVTLVPVPAPPVMAGVRPLMAASAAPHISKKSATSSSQEVLLVPLKGGKVSGSGTVIRQPLVYVEGEPNPALLNVISSVNPAGFVRPILNPAIMQSELQTQRIPSPAELNDSLKQALPSSQVHSFVSQPLNSGNVVSSQISVCSSTMSPHTNLMTPNIYPIRMAPVVSNQSPMNSSHGVRKVTTVYVPLSSFATTSVDKTGGQVAVLKTDVTTSPSKSHRPISSEHVKGVSTKENKASVAVNGEQRDSVSDCTRKTSDKDISSVPTLDPGTDKTQTGLNGKISSDIKDSSLSQQEGSDSSKVLEKTGDIKCDIPPQPLSKAESKIPLNGQSSAARDILQLIDDTKSTPSPTSIDKKPDSKNLDEFEELENQFSEAIQRMMAAGEGGLLDLETMGGGMDAGKRKRRLPADMEEVEADRSGKKLRSESPHVQLDVSEVSRS